MNIPRLLIAITVAAVVAIVVVVVVVLNGSSQMTGEPVITVPRNTGPVPSGTVNPKTAPTPPAHGVYFGARIDPAIPTQVNDIAAVSALQQQIGRRLDIVHVYLKWQAPFPRLSDLTFMRQGAMLLLSWAGTDTQAIISGHYDSFIRQRAREIKATGRKIFLEWRWEMDRPNLRDEEHSPADYIAAWDHIRSIFIQEHVNNVAWVWCPTARGFAEGDAAAFYPGSKEVDWVCVDAYPGVGPYRSFATIMQPFLKWAAHHPKPIMVGEYGVPQTYSPQQRAQWLSAAAQTVKQNPQIKALVYYDSNVQQDYSLDSGSQANTGDFRRL